MNLALVQCAGHIDHRCRSRQIFGSEKDFCPISLEKILDHFLCEYFLKKNVFGMKKSFHVILHTLGSIFSNESMLDAIFTRSFQGVCQGFHRFCPDFRGFCQFSGILPGFSPHQNFWGAVAPPAPTYTTNIGKQTVLARSKSIKSKLSADYKFSKKFLFFAQFPEGGKWPFPPADAHVTDHSKQTTFITVPFITDHVHNRLRY